ncbi:hypothetical protein SAMN02910353_02924 [Ruminococcus sp. YRD2003]|uniref:hypothetical protein n=1 Tax=Ruminococcus sp. YRD2003 TaxID=1452313 RepID=UPI0008CF69B3|nr:hypothetical protein SAMN02910353_02924 [Ruminococcus flavefaciens]
MLIKDNQKMRYYEVWLTNEEQAEVDRAELTKKLLSKKSDSKYKVVYYLSGSAELYPCIEGLLLENLRRA